MKLRTQFLVLVGGIIAVPFLVSTFMLFEQFYAARGREPLPNARQAANITCAGILSHESALKGGAPLRLPEWTLSSRS